MSATLNMTQQRNIQWKGKTFNQVTSLLKQNTSVDIDSKNSFFLPPPLKIYRREIVTSSTTPCNSRTSMSIDELNRPNGSIVNSSVSTQNQKGSLNTLDINLTSNTYERPGTCSYEKTGSNTTCLTQEANARRRVRSSGMIKRQFDISKNNDTVYHTSTNQYLVSRNRTFQQNQYNYIRQGYANVKPGDALSSQNVYSANGINHCNKYYIASDTSFGYQWIDSSYNTVDISSGYYTTDEVNDIFKKKMTSNFHYLINRSSGTYVYFLNIAHNNSNNTVELQALRVNNTIFDNTNYSLPLDRYSVEVTTWSSSLSSTTVVPGFKINNNIFKNAIGFNAGNYPTIAIGGGTQVTSSNQTFSSSSTPGLHPLYIPIYYKPSNPQFSQQGAVSSSSLTARNKYNSITNNTAVYRNAYGLSVANALAYGVPEGGYTWKDKVGYPTKQTPVFSKYTDGFIKNGVTKLVNSI